MNKTTTSKFKRTHSMLGADRIWVGDDIRAVYRITYTLEDLYHDLRGNQVEYSPKYQRGRKKKADGDEYDTDLTVSIHDPSLDIERKKAEEIAYKLITNQLYDRHLTWNMRRPDDAAEEDYDEVSRTVTFESRNKTTIPDSAHRHFGAYLAAEWKKNDGDTIPESIVVNGVTIERAEVESELLEFDPEEVQFFVTVYHLTAEREGVLFDEINGNQKPVSTAVSMALNPDKTPIRRFVKKLMDTTQVLGEAEVETRRNQIAPDSRRIVTNATLAATLKPFANQLAKWEADGSADDLASYIEAVFTEVANRYPVWTPGASLEVRQAARKDSMVVQTVTIYGLVRLAVEWWQDYRSRQAEWRDDSKTLIRRISLLAKEDNGKNPLDKEHPYWTSSGVLVSKRNKAGERVMALTNNRNTVQAAYNRLAALTGWKEEPAS